MSRKIESLKELNNIVQKPRYKEVGNWMVRHILRDLALPITWLLLHTSITANQVTLISIGVAFMGMAFFSCPSSLAFFISVFLLQAWYLLDHVDGQIARYHKTASLSGRFFDFIMHHLVHGALFFSFGVYAYFKYNSFFWIFVGFLASLSIMLFNNINDTKYKTFFERIFKDQPQDLQLVTSQAKKPTQTDSESVKRKIFSLLHKSCEIHVVLNVLLGASILQFFLGGIDLRMLLNLYYCVTAIMLAIAKLTYVIGEKKIDAEFEENFSYTTSNK